MRKYQNMSKRRLAALVLALSVIAAATQVSAQSLDLKAYPPTMCVSAATSYTARYSNSSTYLSSAGTLICGGVKDRFGNTYTQSGGMRVYDNNATYDMMCYMVLRDVNGTSVDWDSDVTSGTPGNDALSFSVETGSAGDQATFVYYCTLPAGGSSLSIKSYWVDEYNTVD